ncbi:MAG: hypothetical protein ACFFDB_00730 [Promethearchaeota archaeon]
MNRKGKTKVKIRKISPTSSTVEFDRRSTIIRIFAIIVILVASGFTGFIIASIAAKNINIHLYSSIENLDKEYQEINLIYEREEEDYKLELDLDDGDSNFNIVKSSELKAFEIEKDIVIFDNKYDNDTVVMTANYTYTETNQVNQSVSNIEEVNGLLYNNYSIVDYNATTKHYESVWGFFNDEVDEEPTSFNVKSGFSYVRDEKYGRSNILELVDQTEVERSFTSKQNGTIELAIFFEYYQNGIIEIKNGGNNLIKLSTYGNQLKYYNGLWYTSSGSLSSNSIPDNIWAIIRIDFRCDNAPAYKSLAVGKYDVYLNDIKIYEDKNLLSYSENINEIEIESKSSHYSVYLDSISITGELKEVSNETYQVGDIFNTLKGISKDIYYDFSFLGKNYKYLKNASLTVNIGLNNSLSPKSNNNLLIYNYFKDNWDSTGIQVYKSKNFTKDITNIQFFNDTTNENTDIHFRFNFFNIYYNFTWNLSVSVKAYYWKTITELTYTTHNNFNGELSIVIEDTAEYREREIEVISIIDITLNYCFGSWIFSNQTIINHTIIFREEIYILDFEHDIDLQNDSFFGWSELNIEIIKISLSENEIKTEYHWGEWRI